MVIEPQFGEANIFKDGVAVVYDENKSGLLDKSGKIVWVDATIVEAAGSYISDFFCSVTPFSEGFALIYKDSKYGYIDTTGEVVIKPQFYYASPFEDGLAPVDIDGKIAYINKTGKIVWKEK